MSRFKIVISDYYYPNLNAEYKEFEKLGCDIEVIDCTKIVAGGIKDSNALLKYAADADALIVQFAVCDAEFIAKLKKCKVIARYAIGVDTIDVEAAKAKGIYVSNVPDYCVAEVANNAAAHILNGIRKLTVARDQLLSGAFDMNNIRPIWRMEEQTLGLLGFGNIARNLYTKMRPFFKRIVAYDPYFSDKSHYADVDFLTLEEVLYCSDIISIHIPLMPSTYNILSEKEFSYMKPGVILVNTARGGLIDEEAMMNALENGKIGFCGLDVVRTEDFSSSPFLNHPNVCLTPHIGWCSEEALAELQKKTAANVVGALIDGVPLYHV